MITCCLSLIISKYFMPLFRKDFMQFGPNLTRVSELCCRMYQKISTCLYFRISWDTQMGSCHWEALRKKFRSIFVKLDFGRYKKYVHTEWKLPPDYECPSNFTIFWAEGSAELEQSATLSKFLQKNIPSFLNPGAKKCIFS